MARKKRRNLDRVVSKMRLSSLLRTQQRKKKVRLRKNFGPTLIVILALWTALTYVFLFIDPARTAAVPVFFFLLFAALVFTLSTLLANTRRGVILSVGTTVYLLLMYLGVGTFINFILIIAITIFMEIYFIKA